MADDVIDYSVEKPKGGIFYGAFKARSVEAKILKTNQDRNGNDFHSLAVDFECLQADGESKVTKAFFMLPFDYWKDGEKGEPISPFRQFCDVLKKSLNDFKGKSVSQAFSGHDVTILIGAQRHWKTGELQMWGDNDDKINYGVVGFAPYAKGEKAWTTEMEEREQLAIEESKGAGKEKETQPGFAEEPDPSSGGVATGAGVEEAFKEEKW